MLPLKDIAKLVLSRSNLRNPFNDIFSEIEFESTAYCNRKCVYCPNVDYERFGEDDHFLMKEEVFKKLISQLKDLNFQGLISPHLYGEPMSDPRMPSWIKHIREELPRSRIKIVTNGDYLNVENFEIFKNSGVNIFFISKHSKKLKKPCRELLEYLTDKEKKKYILVQDFYTDFSEEKDMFNNRGGSIKIDNNKRPPVNCSYSTYPVINSIGDLILCCQDFHNNYVFGNIMQKSLKEIWYDEKNINMRKKIYDYKFDLKICQDCKM
jgi:GTP 3',8-cyclase